MSSRDAAELSMPVQASYLESIRGVEALHYAWSEDGTLLLTLDCSPVRPTNRTITYGELYRELRSLCPWQLKGTVVIGFPEALIEVLTMYHQFEFPRVAKDSLTLVCTPPVEYFEQVAAAA